MTLDDWRSEIDQIDSEMIGLLNRRMRAAGQIGELKLKSGMPVADREREDEIMRKIIRENEGAIDNETIVRIYGLILQKSRRTQLETIEKLKHREKVC